MKTKWNLVPFSNCIWVCLNTDTGGVVAIMKRKNK